MSVAGEVPDDLVAPEEGWLGIDDPGDSGGFPKEKLLRFPPARRSRPGRAPFRASRGACPKHRSNLRNRPQEVALLEVALSPRIEAHALVAARLVGEGSRTRDSEPFSSLRLGQHEIEIDIHIHIGETPCSWPPGAKERAMWIEEDR